MRRAAKITDRVVRAYREARLAGDALSAHVKTPSDTAGEWLKEIDRLKRLELTAFDILMIELAPLIDLPKTERGDDRTRSHHPAPNETPIGSTPR